MHLKLFIMYSTSLWFVDTSYYEAQTLVLQRVVICYKSLSIFKQHQNKTVPP